MAFGLEWDGEEVGEDEEAGVKKSSETGSQTTNRNRVPKQKAGSKPELGPQLELSIRNQLRFRCGSSPELGPFASLCIAPI